MGGGREQFRLLPGCAGVCGKGDGEHGLSERVVLDLTEQYRGREYRIFCDNFFSSPRLFQELHSRSLHACGTVRPNRCGFPLDLRSIKLQAGECRSRQSGPLTAVVWQDKKAVNVLSTLSQPGSLASVSRRQRDGTLRDVASPSAITMYTKHMGGVDLGDQLRKYYGVRLKCNKNYKYIFWFMFDVCVTNAYILSRFVPSSVTSLEQERLKNFRVRLAKALIGDYNSRQRAPVSRLHHLDHRESQTVSHASASPTTAL